MIEDSPGPGAADADRSDAENARLEPVWRTGRKRGRSRLRKRISRNVGYAGFRLAHALVSRLPWVMGRALGALVGWCAHVILKRERDIATQSLTRVYGQVKSAAEIRRIVRGVFRHTVSIIIDWVIVRRWSRERVARKFPEVVETIRALEAEVKRLGTGVVAITAHCGNWELLAHFFSLFAPGLLVPLAKRLYFEKYQDFIHHLRTEHGLELLYSDESARKMIRAVRDGKVLSLLCDQDLRTNSGVFVDFFGLPAYTVTFPVNVALKAGVPMAFCILVKEGPAGFRVIYRTPYALDRSGDEEAQVLAATQKWTSILEEEIRERPEQWSWIHPRWRSTPDKPRRQVDPVKRKERSE